MKNHPARLEPGKGKYMLYFILNERAVSFLKKSNRYKHLVGGLLVGLCALSPWAAIYSAIVAASCLELKDKLHGCPWDWIDWACTVLGGFIAMLFWLIV